MENKVTVELSTERSELMLKVRFGNDPRAFVCSKPLTSGLIEEVQEQLRSRLAEVFGALAPTSHTPAVLNEDALRRAYQTLRRFSSWFLNQVFEEDARDQLLSKLRDIRTPLAMEKLLFGNHPVGVIDYVGPIERALPIEYIFLDTNANTDADTSSFSVSLTRRFTGFLGFAFDVRRIPLVACQQGTQDTLPIPSSQDNRLGIWVYPYDGLPTVHMERAFLTLDNAHVFAAEVIDLGSNQEEAEWAVGHSLGASDGPPVHHFACHFSPRSRSSSAERKAEEQSQFLLGPGEGRFRVGLYEMVSEHEDRCSDSWVAFLNACETGGATTYDLGGVVPVFFRVFRSTCLIGPAYRVIDGFASEFGRVFYGYWLRYRDLGLALFKTRWFFIRRYNNPMGLFYVYFATRRVRLDGAPQYAFL